MTRERENAVSVLDSAFTLFAERLRKRWAGGAKRYGDASFRATMAETCRQVMEELEDVPGWSFVLWLQARMHCGEAIDLARRQDYEAEFLAAMRSAREPRNAVDKIARLAGDAFHRWHAIRLMLAGILHDLAQVRCDATKGPRGSIRDPRSSD